MTVKTLRVNGYAMAYLERGAGVPLVLVHGALSDFRGFEQQMEPFGNRHRVIAVGPPRFSAMAQLFQQCLAKQERVVIPKAGHGMFYTNPQATNAAVLAFLDRH